MLFARLFVPLQIVAYSNLGHKNLFIMCTSNDIDNYRLTSMEEPSDEMLAQMMHEAAVDANEANARATARFFEELRLAASNI